MTEQEHVPTPAFWTAFFSGVVAPVSLYTPPAPYAAYTTPLTPAQSFGLVGLYLQTASAEAIHGRREPDHAA